MTACCNIGMENAKVEPHNEERQAEYSVEDNESYVNKNRNRTDQPFIILFGVFLLVLIALLAYCMSYGNIYRIFNGYDNCGNVCGRINTFAELDGTGCRGMDLRQRNYLRVQSFGIDEPTIERINVNRICVENCSNYSGYRQLLNRCLPEKSEEQVNSYFSKTGFNQFFQEAAEDLHICWMEVLYMCIIAFVFSVIILLMFKHLAKVIVWIVLIGLMVMSIITTIFLWIYYSVERQSNPPDSIGKRRVNTFLVLAIVATVATVIICIVIVFLRKRIHLVIALFKEAGKAASDMPLLLFEPVLTFIALTIVISLWFYFTLWIESSGILTIQSNTSAQYIKDDTMKVTRWYNLMAFFWASQFIIGCQHMVIAGAVSMWYFTRNKNELDSPILTSFKNLVSYHLGTVALGSLLIASLQMIRSLLRFIDYSTKSASNRATECCSNVCQCCVVGFQNFLQFISRNAYIETAIYGEPFFVAGRKAFHQLMSNSLRVFTINSLGDFVLFMGKAFIVVITVFSGIELLRPKEGIIHHMWIPLTFAGIFAYLIAHCFITVYEMIIDTIFLCFCEDCERNDGLSRPYFMSSGLMDFVEKSKKYLAITDINDNRIDDTPPKQTEPKA